MIAFGDVVLGHVGQEAGRGCHTAAAQMAPAGLSCCQVVDIVGRMRISGDILDLLGPSLPCPLSLVLPLPPSDSGLARGHGGP